MSTTMEAAEARLQAVLEGPPPGHSHRDTIAELAEQRAATGPPGHLHVKEVATRARPADAPAAELTGQFQAVVSTWDKDRQGEAFLPTAFNAALHRIRSEGKSTPILFGHQAHDLLSVMGAIPPTGWAVDGEGLKATGWVDVADVLGQRVFRMLRENALQWSGGFRRPTKRKAEGVTYITGVDELIEVSITPLPANPATRTTSAKSAERPPPTLAELAELERRVVGPEVPSSQALELGERVRELMRHLLRPDDDHGRRGAKGSSSSSSTPSRPVALERRPPPARVSGPLRVAEFEVEFEA